MFEKLRLQTFFTEKNKQLFLWPVFIQENMVHRNNYFFFFGGGGGGVINIQSFSFPKVGF